jgi:long-subunit fatty acid transport protein
MGVKIMMHGQTALKQRSFWLAFVFLVIISTGPLFAQVARIEIPASMNPVGSGARALGMGGAFIGVADDATAASWNPGGLIQLETPEISIVGSYVNRIEDLTFNEDPDASGTQEISKTSLNYFSAALPFTALNRNMIVSINYQNLYDFARSWNVELFETIPEENATISNLNLEQDGSLSAIGVAYAIQVTPRFSLGLTLNVWPKNSGGNLNGWEQKQQWSGQTVTFGVPFDFTANQKDKYTFDSNSINANSASYGT